METVTKQKNISKDFRHCVLKFFLTKSKNQSERSLQCVIGVEAIYEAKNLSSNKQHQ
jgi:hypothetical protein